MGRLLFWGVTDCGLFVVTDFTFRSAKLEAMMKPLENKRKAMSKKNVSKLEAERKQSESKVKAKWKQNVNSPLITRWKSKMVLL